MAAVAAHCREKETRLRYLTPSSGRRPCEEPLKRNGTTSICLSGRGEDGGGVESCSYFLNDLRENRTHFHERRFNVRLKLRVGVRTQLTDEEVALRLPAVVQTVDERMLELPLHEHKNSLEFRENTYLVPVFALYSPCIPNGTLSLLNREPKRTIGIQ